jgi:hypothetical protein
LTNGPEVADERLVRPVVRVRDVLTRTVRGGGPRAPKKKAEILRALAALASVPARTAYSLRPPTKTSA